MLERKLYCSDCNKEIEAGEDIYAKMKAPKHKIMVEIKAYLKKESDILCQECFGK
ncbi:Fe3+ hydroxamate ABC transporter substrate-binding protein [Gracilibacillus salinarum]|uniref:Fe3+ hydroxamate ABC transporter substrate-binding protein n=1 Tax=Gracilibacillus salinarum TaxID=2932255 RepID=A0ABY4GH78_9BACI|nr:Fe3+ hydroxamate ABC transporter substrate-binding protein [Gracilibacillus salinarum]UOQ83607.1 Fe3+ hydroxamate ABC transporter substrate-binding protein [Gracilibacillus salinarum]